MGMNLIAKASVNINAPAGKVWDALVNPELIGQYMFGAKVASEWREGSPIFWRGEWQGKSYEDRGMILEFKPGRRLRYSHFSPLSGLQDKPENSHNVAIELAAEGNQVNVFLTQDNNATEEARVHSEKNWGMMLAVLKRLLEQ